MVIGGSLGILFVTLLRRVMVEDPELPFPESVAASEIHKAGQQGATAAKMLFANMGLGGLIYLLGAFQLFNASNTFPHHTSAGRQPPADCEPAPIQRRDHVHGRGHAVHGTCDQPCLSGRGLHHRTAAGSTELRRWRGGVGIAGPANHLLPRPVPCRPRWRRARKAIWPEPSGTTSSDRSPLAA